MSNPAYQAGRAAASRERIIAAALKLFVERGFESVKLQDIARAANVSTATLFKHFPQKDDMLSAAIAALATLEGDAPIPITPAFSPDALRLIGLAYARRLDNPMMLGLIRLGVADGGRNPQLGPVVSDAWRKPFIARLMDVLEQGIQSKALIIADRTVAVRQFFGLITDHILWPRLLGLTGHAVPGYKEAVVDEAIRTFIARFKAH